MIQNVVVTDFGAGELDPKLSGRVDIPAYPRGAALIRNWVPIPQGGITMAPGTEFLCALSAQSRLISWYISSTVRIIVILSPFALYWFKDGILSASIAAPWSSTEIFGVKVSSTYDGSTAYLCLAQRGQPPKMLTYSAGTVAFMSPFTPKYVPKPASESDSMGSYQDLFSAGNYPGAVAFFASRLWFAGTTANLQNFWATRIDNPAETRGGSDPSVYEDFRIFERRSFNATDLVAPPTAAAWVATHAYTVGERMIATIATVGYVYRCTVAGTSGASINPSVPAVDGETFVDGTVTWAYVSRPDDLSRVVTAVNRDLVDDSHAIMFSIASDQSDEILWIATDQDLVVGTPTAEWIIGGDATARSALALLMSRCGSANLAASKVGSAMIFVQGKRFCEYQKGYPPGDLNHLNEQILAPGVVQWDFAQIPHPRIHAVLADGTMASLLYDRASGALAWYRRALVGATIESVAVLGSSGDDEVYVVVNRSGSRSLERFGSLFSANLLDSFVSVPSAGATVTGLARFNGLVVTIHAVDWSVEPVTATVSGGSVAVPGSHQGKAVIVGKDYTATMTSMRIVTEGPGGLGIFDLKRIPNIWLRLFATRAISVEGSGASEAVSLPSTPYTGDAKAAFPAGWEVDRAWSAVGQAPWPATVLAAVIEAEV